MDEMFNMNSVLNVLYKFDIKIVIVLNKYDIQSIDIIFNV